MISADERDVAAGLTRSMERFSRQVALPEVGRAGQEALAKARVLVIGCGGLASPVCTYLAAAGIGKVGIIDDDDVEISNLQRQVLFNEDDVGKKKVEAARAQLKLKAPGVEVEIHRSRFVVKNATQIASGYDVLVDCSDNFPTKYLASDVAVKLALPFVYGSVTGFDGQFGVFDGSSGSCFRCFLPERESISVRNCREAGVLGAAVGVVGSWQALESLKVILHRAGCDSAKPRYGQISVLNLLNPEQVPFLVTRRPSCICHRGRDLKLAAMTEQACVLAAPTVTWNELGSLGKVASLDVREEEELEDGCIPGVKHWPLSRIERREWPDFLGNEATWILVCAMGVRSIKAGQLLSLARPGMKFFSLKGGLKTNSLSIEKYGKARSDKAGAACNSRSRFPGDPESLAAPSKISKPVLACNDLPRQAPSERNQNLRSDPI